MQSQIGFNFSTTGASLVATTPVTLIHVPFCPPELKPDALVALDEPSLALSEDASRTFIRGAMSKEDIEAEIEALSQLADKRSEYGNRGDIGLNKSPSTYQDVGTAASALNWMHDHEITRMHQLKQALPLYCELAAEARDRIKARIAARKANRLEMA